MALAQLAERESPLLARKARALHPLVRIWLGALPRCTHVPAVPQGPEHPEQGRSQVPLYVQRAVAEEKDVRTKAIHNTKRTPTGDSPQIPNQAAR